VALPASEESIDVKYWLDGRNLSLRQGRWCRREYDRGNFVEASSKAIHATLSFACDKIKG